MMKEVVFVRAMLVQKTKVGGRVKDEAYERWIEVVKTDSGSLYDRQTRVKRKCSTRARPLALNQIHPRLA
jgi:hypothetical protein